MALQSQSDYPCIHHLLYSEQFRKPLITYWHGKSLAHGSHHGGIVDRKPMYHSPGSVGVSAVDCWLSFVHCFWQKHGGSARTLLTNPWKFSKPGL